MDGITPPRPKRRQTTGQQQRHVVYKDVSVPQQPPRLAPVKTHKKKRLLKIAVRLPRRIRRFYLRHKLGVRIGAGLVALMMIATTVAQVVQPRLDTAKYNISRYESRLLDDPVDLYGKKVTYDNKTQAFLYNEGYQQSGEVAGLVASPKISASFNAVKDRDVTVTDPVTNVSLTFKPQFGLDAPQQNVNRIIYPLKGKAASNVYTLKANGLKEDIILNEYQGDNLEFNYKLGLTDGTEARAESDGSIAIYGADSALLGNVSTGSDKDSDLLKKARDKAEKTQLLFRIPAPFVMQPGKKPSPAKAWYSLKDDTLTLYASGLRGVAYPLSIDPSVYVETASKLMRGNNESNIDFDVDNELIQKGKTTGARFDAWTSSLALPNARWNHSTAVAGGYIYVAGGNSGSAAVGTVYWAKFNTTTGAIEAPNPGTGACASWCNNAVYDLPAVRDGASMVAYNGYLYVFGGRDNAGAHTSTVYIAKIGANGEPSLWHPTDTNKSNWVYWYSDTALSTERSFSGAAAYNNRMYLLGGQTNASSGGMTTVEKADITPVGKLGTWSTTSMVALPSARHGHNVQVYNDRMYVIGGNTSGTLKATVEYIKINNDGTMTNNSWISTTSFVSARMSWGGNFSTIWGGYIYVTGGCTAVNGSGYCTTIASDIQLASINADGSITDWGSIAGVTSARIGFGFVAWRNVLYGIGGCTAHNTTTGACTTTATLTQYGRINQDGDASTVSTSVASGTTPCISTTWYDCDIPPEGTSNGQGGRMSGGTVINNGYIYYIGGCTAVNSGSVCFTGNAGKAADNISYAAIAADGTITRIASCAAGVFYGSWCVMNTTLPGEALAAFGYAVFNNVIYLIGGTTGTLWQSNVWRSTFNNDGSWGTWSSQTFTNLNLGNAKGYQYVFTRANPSSASTYPGNLYVLGGCSGVTAADDGLDCTGTMYTEVYKCNIMTTGALEEADANDCDTANQVQIDSEVGTSGNQGLGVMAGTVYANYVYLIGGQSPNQSERGSVMYAKIDNNNNIVDVDGETTNDNIWETSVNSIDPVRRRGVAFGYNGYLYALAGYNVSAGGSLNDLLFAKINVSDGSIGAFSTSAVTVSARWDLRAVVNNGYVYAIGGCSTGAPPASCTLMTGTVQTFQLYNNYSGSPAAYSAGANLFTTDRLGASSAVLNGYIYIAGGCTVTASGVCTTATDNVQYASLSSSGAIGTWANTTDATLPAVRVFGQLEAAGGTLYYIGGQSSTATDERLEVYYGTPSAGDVSSWNTATNGLPAERTQHSATVWNDRIYVSGGLNASAAAQNTVYVSPQLSSGGNITSAWSTTTAFNVARGGHTMVSYANNLYIFGGHDGTNYLNDSQYSSIGYKTGTISQSGTTVTGSGTSWSSGQVGSTLQYSDGSKATITGYTSGTSITVDASKTVSSGTTYVIQDGSVGAWSYTTSLPTRLRQADGFAANGFMYLFGGRSADTTCVSNTIVAPISANTTIATGNNPTGIGEWFETNVKYTGDRYGASAVYNEGKAYLIGGGCGASGTLTGANRIVQTTLQSQPQIAKYSRFIDTDTDVFPTKWLMNGLDNSTGAEWYMKYRSSTASTAAWGQETDYGTVTLGLPATYIPKDSGGTNTNFARFYYMTVTIDSQQAYGYPEDVTRGPTIADLSLFFTADPSKRMRHGKTFTGGEQQPLDTPF